MASLGLGWLVVETSLFVFPGYGPMDFPEKYCKNSNNNIYAEIINELNRLVKVGGLGYGRPRASHVEHLSSFYLGIQMIFLKVGVCIKKKREKGRMKRHVVGTMYLPIIKIK